MTALRICLKLIQEFHTAVLYTETIKCMVFASTAGGLNNRHGAAFSSLKKYAALFFNTAFGGTEDKELPYAVAGNGAKEFAGGLVCEHL